MRLNTFMAVEKVARLRLALALVAAGGARRERADIAKLQSRLAQDLQIVRLRETSARCGSANEPTLQGVFRHQIRAVSAALLNEARQADAESHRLDHRLLELDALVNSYTRKSDVMTKLREEAQCLLIAEATNRNDAEAIDLHAAARAHSPRPLR